MHVAPGAANFRVVDGVENNRLWDTLKLNLFNRNTQIQILDNLCAQLGIQHDSAFYAFVHAVFNVNHQSNVNIDTRHFTSPSVLCFLFATTFMVMSFVLAMVAIVVSGQNGVQSAVAYLWALVSICYDCVLCILTGVLLPLILSVYISKLAVERIDKCAECIKEHFSKDMVACLDCGDMRLCLLCSVHSHNGHEKHKLIDYIKKKKIVLIENGMIELYSPFYNTSQLLSIAIQKREDHIVGVRNDATVIVAGGMISGQTTAATELISLASKQVTLGPPMTFKRKRASSEKINGELYVCGGWDESHRALNSCEVYRDGQWLNIAAMHVPRAEHAIVALDGLLYAIGGYNSTGGRQGRAFFPSSSRDFSSPSFIRDLFHLGHLILCTHGALDSVECYSPVANCWRPVAHLNHKRQFLSAAALNGYIYVAGGVQVWDDFDNSCNERYNPTTDQWERMEGINKARAPFSLVALAEKLYALGGDGEKSVESWNPKKERGWAKEEITLKTDAVRSAVVVLYDN